MKITKVWITNFTSVENLQLRFEDTVALVGQNNAGKSNILKALEVFFDLTHSKITEDSFYQRDTGRAIEITVEFSSLDPKEAEYFSSYTYNNTLKVKRKIEWNSTASKPIIHHIGFSVLPKIEWLRKDSVSGENIEKWWSEKDRLAIGGMSFAAYLGTRKPSVSAWKDAALKFIEEHKDVIEFQEIERENISGYEGVLKGGLPKFIMVPAVRDILDEAKVGKSNPFGELIHSVLSIIPDTDKGQVARALEVLSGLLNSSEGTRRIRGIDSLEKQLNVTLSELVLGCKLQLEVQTPTMEDVFNTVKIIADDGFRGVIERKGQGLQRYVIFTILKTYAESLRAAGDGERQRSIIFAIEEPEIYLHPQAQRTMYHVLFEIGKKRDQVIYSTHSNLMVDIAYFDRLCLVSRKKIGDRYRTDVKQLSINEMIEDLKARYPRTNPTEQSMRERYSHVYTPSRNEGFFAQKIILVEGQTEEYAFPIYSQSLGYDLDHEGVSAISAGGKGLIDRLLRLFNEFGIPCYVVFDGDKDSDDAENKRMTKELLDLLGHSSEQPGTTIVEQHFAMFGGNFEEVMRGEVPDYSVLVEEARKLLGLKADGGAPLISRYVATKLVDKGRAEGNPSKYVPPTLKQIIDNVRRLEWKASILKKLANHQPSGA